MIISDERLVQLAERADSVTFRATGLGASAAAMSPLAAEVFKVLVAQEPERAAQAERDETQARLDRIRRDAEHFPNTSREQLDEAHKSVRGRQMRINDEGHRPGRAL